MSDKLAIIVLGAGKGTRMKLKSPKVLIPALGEPLINHVLRETSKFSNNFKFDSHTYVVIGHEGARVEAHLKNLGLKNFSPAWQKEQKGTAHALECALREFPEIERSKYILVACGDAPLITSNELSELHQALMNDSKLKGVCASFHLKNPFGYGRIKRHRNGFEIIEEKDAGLEDKQITEVNSWLYLLKTDHVFEVIKKIDNKNKAGEFYLTDMFKPDYPVQAVTFSHETSFLGVNTIEQLARAHKELQRRKNFELMNSGVILIDPETNLIESQVEIAPNTIIAPYVAIKGRSKISENVEIESHCTIKESIINEGTTILAQSYLQECQIGKNCQIGPYARLRPGSHIGQKAKIGNFVEVKKSVIGDGSKVSHLSYVGDGVIGKNVNIGCGFITCNYDGRDKHQTKIGDGSFIGSDCQTVAPVEIGDDCFVAAGSTINQNLASGDFAIARSKQVTKEGLAKKYLNSKNS